ncbi:Capsular polysaccharide biosynthesis protein [Actinomyces ruminicola]|uniref:Capsular polysaccharide biosynthesis protein n=1 Tax=Actinomyces ruminicola TaxID=332524 RepID=A0A1G9ZHR6_9ACTO|nr:Wzz/FepE/Etk N-terminal domain-containing protein [Actinomyces ruminicola]SDN20043.1 Capsular polysaccharide biosynthesis protein [Actinomyces ruminicola]
MQELLTLVRRGLVWIIALGVVGGVAGGVLAATADPTYTATSMAYVQVKVDPEEGISGYSYASTVADSATDGFLPIITSPAVAQKVIDELGLTQTPTAVASWISATRVTGSPAIEIQVSAPSREVAIAVADAVVTHASNDLGSLAGEDYPVSLTLLSPAQDGSVTQAPSLVRYAAAGVVGGVIIGIIVAFMLATSRTHRSANVRTGTGSRVRNDAPPPPGQSQE